MWILCFPHDIAIETLSFLSCFIFHMYGLDPLMAKNRGYTLSYPQYLRNLSSDVALSKSIFYLWNQAMCHRWYPITQNSLFSSQFNSHFPNLTTFSSLWKDNLLGKIMASLIPLHTIIPRYNTVSKTGLSFAGLTGVPCSRIQKNKNRTLTVVSAVGDVSADGNTYLIAGAIAVALVGTAFPILFSRKDTYVASSLPNTNLL